MCCNVEIKTIKKKICLAWRAEKRFLVLDEWTNLQKNILKILFHRFFKNDFCTFLRTANNRSTRKWRLQIPGFRRSFPPSGRRQLRVRSKKTARGAGGSSLRAHWRRILKSAADLPFGHEKLHAFWLWWLRDAEKRSNRCKCAADGKTTKKLVKVVYSTK